MHQMVSVGTQIKDIAFPIITVPSFLKSDKNWPRYDLLKNLFERIQTNFSIEIGHKIVKNHFCQKSFKYVLMIHKVHNMW